MLPRVIRCLSQQLANKIGVRDNRDGACDEFFNSFQNCFVRSLTKRGRRVALVPGGPPFISHVARIHVKVLRTLRFTKGVHYVPYALRLGYVEQVQFLGRSFEYFRFAAFEADGIEISPTDLFSTRSRESEINSRPHLGVFFFSFSASLEFLRLDFTNIYSSLRYQSAAVNRNVSLLQMMTTMTPSLPLRSFFARPRSVSSSLDVWLTKSSPACTAALVKADYPLRDRCSHRPLPNRHCPTTTKSSKSSELVVFSREQPFSHWGDAGFRQRMVVRHHVSNVHVSLGFIPRALSVPE